MSHLQQLRSNIDEAVTRLITVEQVCRYFGRCSPAWVRDHATRKQPRLKCVKVGKLLRFRPEDLEEFIRTCCQ